MNTPLVTSPAGSHSGPITHYTFPLQQTSLYTLLCSLTPFHLQWQQTTDGSYAFFQNILALESASNSLVVKLLGFLPEKEWDPFLKTLLDQQFAAFLRRGICDGFRLGVSPLATLVSTKSNSPSTLALATKVDKYIKEEVNLAPSPVKASI